MTVDLSVLESLGINLYSNAAAVLSELVANAYDADATTVSITWNQGESVTVVDNGAGMSVDEINDRLLKVGYKKREAEGASSPRWNRPFMGRKGIGKLSVFSIAEVVTVYSTKGGKSNGLRIDVAELQDAISAKQDYLPEDVEVPSEHRSQGTTLVLSSLKSKRADLTASALRKRLARRFDVLDQSPAEAGGFAISVNGNRVNWADRVELKKLEFIWEFGQETIPASSLPTGINRYVIPGDVNAARGWNLTGWFGTAKRPTDLVEDEEAGSLKNIIVLARKRPIQEGIIEKLDFSRIFGNYVTGQIEADFLDVDDEDDIATSDRQRLIEDDERVQALQKFLRAAFIPAADEWSKRRPAKEVPDVLEQYPKIGEWIDGLDPYQQDYARTMIGSIASLDFEVGAEDQRRALFRSGILAFERIGLRKATTDLDALSKVTAADVLPLLGRQEDYEAGLWVDILRSRIEAISTFKEIQSADEKEKVLQLHLFDNLWLLDPSWERATGSDHMEQGLSTMAKSEFNMDDATKYAIGRVDIRYRTVSGRHVIVELKRFSVVPDIDDLKAQGDKYASALADMLARNGVSEPDIEVFFILGQHPTTKGKALMNEREYIQNTLRPINGRVFYYDQLIGGALNQYQDYLDASKKSKRLDDVLASIEPTPPTKGGA